MKVFIKECLYVLDYKNRILECIFNSDNHDRAGYAYEVNVQDANTGYSDLNFKMPREIIDRNGKKILNPKLAFLKPLTKIRYTRQVRYIDEEDLRVVNPDGTIDIYHHNDYLKDFMTGKTKYVMDYIIQPLNKNRSSIKIDLSYTAIDFPRYNLSKKKVGLTFDNTTLTTKELSLYKNKPLNTPGYATYIPWTSNEVGAFQLGNAVNSVDKLGSNVKPVKGDVWNVTSSGSTGGLYQYDGFQWNKLNNSNDLLSWSPNAQSGSYPLTEAAIKKLVEQTTFSNGILSTIYYWPVTETGRYQGVLYEKGDFITLSLYNTYEGLEYEGSEYLNSITWEWGHLDKIQPYLSPNTACHYLRYILQNTNWKVKGDKDLFIAHEGARPYFINGEVPENPSEGQYYIKGILSGDTSTGYEFQTEVYRWEDGGWRNKTEESFGQVVNMAATVDALGTVTTDEDFGTLYDIDIEQVEVARSAQASVGEKVLTDARYSLSASNSNCYNAITAEAKTFDLYPVFDCETNTVSLKLNAGAQYGLKYRYGYNLKSSTVKEDGDKVITKLYGTGGVDAQGSANINIGNATRSISGIAPDLVSNRAEHYDKALIQSLMTDLQQNAYNNMVGAPLTTSLNMNGVKFKLSFPDNFYEKAYDFSSQPSSAAVQLISFSSGRSIYMRYNPTGSDHCFYVYDGANPDDYTDETKQLYKYDYSNKALRRNKETYVSNNIGVINSISNRATAIGSLPIVGTYMKYTTPLDEDIQLIKTTYKSSCLDMTINDYSYEINTSLDNNFVLVGPNRIYTVFDNEKTFTTYSLGNYYYFIDEHKYAYCFDKVTEAKKNGASSIYNNINKISITGYAFIVIGEPTDLLYIEVNGNRTKVRDKNGEYITLQQWLSNNYAIRVEWDGTELVEYERDEFDPNADEYLIGRSPYGTNYVYNFKYLYDNGWMTKEDILDIYRVNKIINNINLDFYNKYTQELINLQAKYDDARANNEVYSTKADAQLEALMSNYWINPDAASKGEFSAFPGIPKFSDGGSASDHLNQTNHMYWEKITYPEDPDFEHIVYFNIFGLPGTQYLYPQATNSGIIANNPHNEGQYHTTVKSLGWDDYVTNKLAINEELNGGYTESQNPSGQVENYNEFIKKMKEYYYRAKVSEKAIQEAADDLEALAEETKAWEQTINGYERYIQENYGQYIIEGSYANSEQPYPNLLFDEMVKKSSSNSEIGVSEKFATPNVTYSVNVVDSSGLFEYRNPGKGECNDLIKKLHSLGQIVPRAGDYVSIYDAPMGMYGVPGLITTITRRLDDPLQNNITIDTSYTDAEELVGNIITATNTVLNNKDVYGRAAIINNKGELSATTVSNALSSGTDSINIVSTNGKVNVNDNGLTCTNPGDVANVIRYNGTGILASSNGGVTWRELMTPNGINANYINAGSINASNVSITDGQYDITSLTSDGLAVKSVPGDSYSIGTFNTSTGAANSDWENLTVFVGKDKNGQGVGYFNGYINASKGGNIGGWSILPDRLYNGSGDTYTALSTDSTYAFWAGNNEPANAPISITHSGALKATSGTIGNWYIGTNTLEGKNDGTTYVTLNADLPEDSTHAIDVNNGVFYVRRDGKMYASNAEISGKITANSGKIGGWTINATTLTGGNTTLNSDGTISTKNLNCTGGYIKITKGNYYFSMGDVSNHPIVSGLNVATGSSGISFRTGSSTSSAGKSAGSIHYDGGLYYSSDDKDHYFQGGNVNMSNDLSVDGTANVENNLNVTKNAYIGGNMSCSTIKVDGSTGVSSKNGAQASEYIWLDGDSGSGHEGGRYRLQFHNGILVNCHWES